MKRILLISFEYPIGKAYCGGVGQIVKQSRDTLLDLGNKVFVLISAQFLKKCPVKLLLPDNSIKRYSSLWAFHREYKWHEFNYIIQHFVNWTKEFKKIRNHKGSRPKIIYHFHSILRREKELGFKAVNRFLFNQERMIEIADKIICPSRYEYDNFVRYFPYFSEKVTLIENTVEFFPLQRKIVQDIRTLYKIHKSDLISVYVGRLERIKGADIIIKHISKVLRKHKHLKIFIIGRVLERNIYKRLMRIRKRFPQQIFYIRYLDKNILFQLYYLSHVYINTSLSESFSLTTHESAYCNNALLLNSLPVFDKFRDAALFFSNYDTDGNSFISKFEQLIKDRRLRIRFSRKAARIAKDFTFKNRSKEDYLNLFNKF